MISDEVLRNAIRQAKRGNYAALIAIANHAYTEEAQQLLGRAIQEEMKNLQDAPMTKFSAKAD